ncbi:hypothetical protein LX36DRAFT_492712 [Colletotrichum falcatum]|nr:hypothetical protein LX36DRAFT_492712 [Colletotrichum falcatum]
MWPYGSLSQRPFHLTCGSGPLLPGPSDIVRPLCGGIELTTQGISAGVTTREEKLDNAGKCSVALGRWALLQMPTTPPHGQLRTRCAGVAGFILQRVAVCSVRVPEEQAGARDLPLVADQQLHPASPTHLHASTYLPTYLTSDSTPPLGTMSRPACHSSKSAVNIEHCLDLSIKRKSVFDRLLLCPPLE